VQEIPLANTPAINTPAPAGVAPNQNFPAPGGANIPSRFGGNRPGGGPGGRSGGQNRGVGNGNNNTGMGGGPALNTVPTRNTGSSSGQQQQGAMSGDEQELMMVAQHLKAVQEGSPMAGIFPPTELDKQAGLSTPPALPGSGAH
jgi:hypothetical protein